MGATNNIKEILQDYQIKQRTCRLCSDYLTPDNYLISYRTNNDTNWIEFEKDKSRGWIIIEVEFEHENCPDE